MRSLRLISTTRGQWIELYEGRKVVVGRAPTSDLAVLDPTISRRHTELSCTDRGVTLRDIGSSNGTFVNGTRVSEVTVGRGDVITFGRIDFELVDAEAPGDARPAASPAALGAASDTVIVRQMPTPGTFAATASSGGPAEPYPVLLDLSRDLAHHHDIEALLQRVVDITFDQIAVDSVALLFEDKETGAFVPGLSKSRFDEDPHAVQVPTSIVGRVVNERIAILTDNAG